MINPPMADQDSRLAVWDYSRMMNNLPELKPIALIMKLENDA